MFCSRCGRPCNLPPGSTALLSDFAVHHAPVSRHNRFKFSIIPVLLLLALIMIWRFFIPLANEMSAANAMKAFVTPDDPFIVAQVQSLVSGYDASDASKTRRDLTTLYSWVYRNIDYVDDVSEPLPSVARNYGEWLEQAGWQRPVETLNIRTGDCEDMALLLLSMIRAYSASDIDAYVVIVFFDDGSGHAAVIIPVSGGGLSILDPAGSFLNNPRSNRSAPAAEVLGDWSDWWSRSGDQLGLTVSVCFNDKNLHWFSSNEDFLRWLEG